MAGVFQKVKIIGVKDLTGDVREFTLDNPGGEFKPGQFATIRIEDGQMPKCMRSYSILKGDENKLQMVIKKIENGRGTTFLFDKNVGDELEFLYPLGHFGLPEKLADKLYFIGTGTGVAPLLCMLESLAETNPDAVSTLIFGVRYAADLFYVDRVESLSQRMKNFKLIATVSRPEEDWNGKKGRVTEFLNDVDVNGQFFLCGNHEMILDTKKYLEEKGVASTNIFFENFG